MKLAILILCASLAFAEDPKPAPTVEQLQQQLAAKDATIENQRQLIQALQKKLSALLAYMEADEQIRHLQQAPAKPAATSQPASQ